GPVHDVFEILRGVYFVGAHRERLEKHRDLLGPNVIDNTERGLKWTAADIAWANVEQSKIYRRFLGFFDEVDVLICPAASVSPFPHEQLTVTEINGEPMPTYMRWLAITNRLATVFPAAATIPCGLHHLGMRIGIQVVGPDMAAALVVSVAHALEQLLAEDPATARLIRNIAKLR